MSIKLKIIKCFDAVFNGICKLFGIRLTALTRALSDEEVKALGLDKLEKGQKPTEM